MQETKETKEERHRRANLEYYYRNREKVHKRNKENYLKNRDREIERRKKWHQKHREEQNTKRRKWHEEHREEAIEKMRQNYAANKEREKPKHRAWHHANKEKMNEKRRKWYQDNREYSIMATGQNSYKERLSFPWKKLLQSSIGRAKKKNVPHTLTYEWGEKRWTGYCELTKIPFLLGQKGSGGKFYSPSIDRIVPELGYIPENCRFVLWAVNALKNVGTDEDMLLVAKALTLNYPYISKS